jgi:hypothetical protein
MPFPKTFLVLFGLSLLSDVACTGPPSPAPVPCNPRKASAIEGPESASFAGVWQLVIAGSRRQVLGTLRLAPLDTLDPRIQSLSESGSSVRRMRYYGTWQGDLRRLGIANPDSTGSDDPTRPGARLDIYKPPSLPWEIRLGAQSNNVRYYTLDGYTFSLKVSRATAQQLQGIWSHMYGEMANVREGTWCAVRLGS